MSMCKPVILVTTALVVVGALNWGLVGAFNFDLVAMLLGEKSAASKAVYVLVGLSGLILAALKLGCKCSYCKCACNVPVTPVNNENPKSQ